MKKVCVELLLSQESLATVMAAARREGLDLGAYITKALNLAVNQPSHVDPDAIRFPDGQVPYRTVQVPPEQQS